MPEDVTNRGLGRWLTLENITGFATLVFLGGMAWSGLNADVEALAQDVSDHNSAHSADISALQRSDKVQAQRASEIQVTVSAMAASQEHFKTEIQDLKEGQERLDDKVERNGDKIDEIHRLLIRQYRAEQ